MIEISGNYVAVEHAVIWCGWHISSNYGVETCNCELILTGFGSNYAVKGTAEVTQMALCSCLFPCGHFWSAASTHH